jgi:hypothetical protein
MFNTYIHILLIKAKSIVYICCIKYWEKAVACVLTVRDDELNVGDSEVTLLEVAKAGDMHKGVTWLGGRATWKVGSGFPGKVGEHLPIASEITCFMCHRLLEQG